MKSNGYHRATVGQHGDLVQTLALFLTPLTPDHFFSVSERAAATGAALPLLHFDAGPCSPREREAPATGGQEVHEAAVRGRARRRPGGARDGVPILSFLARSRRSPRKRAMDHVLCASPSTVATGAVSILAVRRWSTPASRRPSRDVGDGDPEASDACVHSVPRSTSTRALLRREGTAARDRRPHRSVGAPAGPEGRGNDPAAFRYIPKIVLM
jgi:hypothetical protein